jgi:hypothetical protein
MGGSNQMLEAGNISVSSPYWISGKTGTLTARAAGDKIACLVNFGMIPEQDPLGTLKNTPINVSQVRLKYVPMTTPATNGVAFEVHKGTATVQHTTGGNALAPQRRKTSGYKALTTTEVSLYIATTGAISGGNFALVADALQPFDVMTLGASTGLSGGESIWIPGDACPLILEQGEACEIRTTAHSGTGILFVAFDFLRQ